MEKRRAGKVEAIAKATKDARLVSSGKDGRDCEKDDWDHRHGRGRRDRQDVHRQSQGGISQSRRQSECPSQEQNANRRSFGNDKSDQLTATSL